MYVLQEFSNSKNNRFYDNQMVTNKVFLPMIALNNTYDETVLSSTNNFQNMISSI